MSEIPKFDGVYQDPGEQLEFCYSRRREGRGCGAEHDTLFCREDTLSPSEDADSYKTNGKTTNGLGANRVVKTVTSPLLNGESTDRVRSIGSILTSQPTAIGYERGGHNVAPSDDDPALD